MDEKHKKIVAAMSAVTRYIQQEEEIIYAQPLPAAGITTAAHAPSGKFRLWGLSGRQAQMQMRNLMQMKAFHGARSMSNINRRALI